PVCQVSVLALDGAAASTALATQILVSALSPAPPGPADAGFLNVRTYNRGGRETRGRRDSPARSPCHPAGSGTTPGATKSSHARSSWRIPPGTADRRGWPWRRPDRAGCDGLLPAGFRGHRSRP